MSPHFKSNPRNNRKHRHQIIWNRPKDGTRGIQANSFYFRVALTWNDRPQNVVEAENIDIFKARLDDAWMNHPTKRSIDIPNYTNDADRFEEAF